MVPLGICAFGTFARAYVSFDVDVSLYSRRFNHPRQVCRAGDRVIQTCNGNEIEQFYPLPDGAAYISLQSNHRLSQVCLVMILNGRFLTLAEIGSNLVNCYNIEYRAEAILAFNITL